MNKWCAREDLNLHAVASTSPSSWRVYQFHHWRKILGSNNYRKLKAKSITEVIKFYKRLELHEKCKKEVNFCRLVNLFNCLRGPNYMTARTQLKKRKTGTSSGGISKMGGEERRTGKKLSPFARQ